MFKKSKFDFISKEDLEKVYLDLKSYDKTAAYFSCGLQVIRRLIKKFNITPNIKGGIRKYNADFNFFSQDNEASFYWAGFIAADGCVYSSNNKSIIDVLHIKLASKDIDHLKKFKKDIGASNPIFSHQHGLSLITGLPLKYSEIRLFSTRIVQDLLRFNIVPAKTKIYEFPQWLINHPLKHHFMRGYFDGDGCASFAHIERDVPQLSFSIVSAQKEFLKSYKMIIEMESNIDLGPDIIVNEDNLAILQYQGNIIVPKITAFLYANASIFLDRKFKRLNYGNKNNS